MNWYKLALQTDDLKQHLEERGVNLSDTKVHYDPASGYAYFMLYNRLGQNIGFQRYNPKGDKKSREPSQMRYHTIVPGDEHKLNAVWGLEYIDFDKAQFIFATEGIFDAIKIKNLGYPVIATMTNAANPSLKTQLKLWGKPIIAILDNDASGNKLKGIATHSFVTPAPHKDLGEMEQKDVAVFIQGCLKQLGFL